VAAHIFTFQMGFSLVSTIDPATQSQVTALSILAQMLVLLLLLAGDGHHWFLLATANSYQYLAPGQFVFTPALAQLLLRLSADALAVGVALAAPAIVALLAVELALAIAGQVVPQLQVFVLSFPLKIIVGLWLVGGALFFLPGAVRTTLSALKEALTQTLAAMT
jgi:flagellar biosynthetic protein FliR